jgi:putative DNA methylase
MPKNPRWFSPPAYGLNSFADLFTPRQLVALTTFSDLVSEARTRVHADALAAGLSADPTPLAENGRGATAYSDAIATYLALSISRWSDLANSISSWNSSNNNVRALFSRQAIGMAWDFVEIAPFGPMGNPESFVDSTANLVARTLISSKRCLATQSDAMKLDRDEESAMISTDPPYYDNIGYADLSDFFYVWLRRALRGVFPSLFETLLVPKAAELVATPYRFEGGKPEAEMFFRNGLQQAFSAILRVQRSDLPMTVYYAYKQGEADVDDLPPEN